MRVWSIVGISLIMAPLVLEGSSYVELNSRGMRYWPTESTVYGALRRKSIAGAICLQFPWTNAVLRKRCSEAQCKNGVPNNGQPLFTVYEPGYRWHVILDHLKRLQVTHIFCAGASHDGLMGDVYVAPIVYAPKVVVKPARVKDILYSFVGTSRFECAKGPCPLRKRVLALPPKNDCILLDRGAAHATTGGARKAKFEQEYRNIISRSRFGLCPRGTSPGTYRFAELLIAGAIPVVFADKLCLPRGFDWDNCVIRIPEKDVELTDDIIRSISPERENLLRSNCVRLATILRDDPAYFIRKFFELEGRTDAQQY